MPAVTLQTGGKYDITYTEAPDPYGEQWQPDGSQAVRGCQVEWANREKFVLSILGLTEQDYDPATGRLVRWLPHEHPSFENMFAVSCSLREKLGVPNQDTLGRITFDERSGAGAPVAAGAGDGSGIATYDVTYRRANYLFAEDNEIGTELDRYVIRLKKFAIENLTLPGQAFKWDTVGSTGTPAGTAVPASQAGNPLAADITKPFPTTTYIYRWLQLPSTPDSKITAGLGKINSATFDGWPAQTLLLQSVDVEPKQHANSIFYWEISYTMVYRATGWNKIYNRTAGDFLPVVNTAAGKPSIYDTYDFYELFKFI